MIGFPSHSRDKLVYLGSPYSNRHQLRQKMNFVIARDATAWFMIQGVYIYSPIVHCHDLAVHYDLPHDYNFWQGYNRRMLQAADEFCMLRIDDWDQSVGLKGEIADAKGFLKPLYQCVPMARGGYEIYQLEI